jgi:CDP-diacylglycerol--glycerol-3-phosphate 3-phosphatidyltransferase
MRGSIWTISNMLSLSRVLLVIPIAKLLMAGDPASRMFAVVLAVAATLTDFFDGLIARKLNQVTNFGKIVDPIADKIAVGVVVCILTLQGRIPLWFLLIVLVRDAAILLGGLLVRKAKGVVLQSNAAGKWAVTFVAALIVFRMLGLPGLEWVSGLLLGGATALLALSSVLYVRRFYQLGRAEGYDGIS